MVRRRWRRRNEKEEKSEFESINDVFVVICIRRSREENKNRKSGN